MLSLEWRLPGPARFLREIVDGSTAGNNVIIVLPRTRRAGDLRAALRDRIPASRWAPVPFDALGGDHHIPTALADAFHLEGDRANTITGLLTSPDLRNRVLWVDATGPSRAVQDWVDFVERLSAAAKEEAIPRTTMVTAVTPDADLTIPHSDIALDVRWWWGVIGPLDTEIYIRELRHGNPLTSERTAVITQIAAYDLELAEELVHWDGTQHSLTTTLKEFRRSLDWEEEAAPAGQRDPLADRPSQDDVHLWNQGKLNLWGEFTLSHSASLPADDHEIQRRIWRGQARTLFVALEEERLKLADWVEANRRSIPQRVMRELDGDIRSQEIKDLHDLIRSCDLKHEKRVEKYAQWLRQTRNSLAHLDIVSPTRLERGRELAKAAERVWADTS